MTSRIEVYFKSEDDVESAHASLRTLKSIRNIYIEEMIEDDDMEMFIPFFPTNLGSSSVTGGALGSYGSFTPFTVQQNSDDGSSYEEMTHLLRFDIKKEDYDQAIEILNKHNSYVLKR